ncbi:O-linked N-acetylglucosamine transferase, SPINDLY family protein [Azospirillum agricola]|uniref:O-linked N-acetylglucosamine transferase, SPINDLY family protein n=1 Tax=Azospirillum agricola TaxID=1720247 RepID=UPI000A0F277E|nr:tetratricopeptide repeat protein [Azospirillum agricola]SMH41111.1 Predicted O-linked N-acetylglucosamine transferase, SPINDLY family [Azospirillum lipoferum]
MTLIEALRLAVQHYQAGRLNEMVHVCQAILAVAPEQPETRQLLGLAAHGGGRSAVARGLMAQAIALKPEMSDAYSNLGVILQALGRTVDAIAAHSHSLRLNPQSPETYLNRGSVYQAQGNREAAAADYLQALRLKPEDPQPLNSLGMVRREQGRARESVDAHCRAIVLNPALPEAYRDLGHILREAGALPRARDAYARAHRLAPARTETLSYHLFVKQAICDWEGYEELVRQTGRIIDEDSGIALPLATLSVDTTAEQQLRSARRFYHDAVCRQPAPMAALPRPAGDGRLRIAYFSADFHEHATAYLAAELFELHDRERFQVFAYSYGEDDGSPMRARLRRAFDHFRDICGVGRDQVAAMVAADGIDILIDLKGYTKQSRLDLLTQRLAPVQVAYLGYPGTVGCALMDYVIGDTVVTPPEHQPFYSERLVALPDAYQINDRHRPIAEATPSRSECGLPEDAFVFCAFNTTYKVTPSIFGAWMRLLGRLPASVLWLFEANDTVTSNLRREAAARGINPARLIFAPKKPLSEHLARYRVADLFVDTFPYTGHTTTSDALWAGLPVVTLKGETFASRVAASLLTAAEMAELVTGSLAEYEELAFRLAGDPERLASLRRRLSDTRMTMPLFDSRRFTRHIERAYAMMWEIHQAGRSPEPIVVPPLPSGLS